MAVCEILPLAIARIRSGGGYFLRPMPTSSAAPVQRVRVTSEIGPLRTVICHTPGAELLAVTPSNREQFLYDDIIDLEQARREHQRFRAILSRFCDVLDVRDLLADIVDEPEVRRFLVNRVMEVASSEPLVGELARCRARS
jgi:arginine deiminase